MSVNDIYKLPTIGSYTDMRLISVPRRRKSLAERVRIGVAMSIGGLVVAYIFYLLGLVETTLWILVIIPFGFILALLGAFN